jgi:hypothetical protein
MCQKMEIEQGYVSKYLSDEDMPPLEIDQRLREHLGEGALSQSQVYYWMNELKLGRIDLANVVSPGRAPDQSSVTVIPNKIESDPHLSTQKLAYPYSLGMAAPTVNHDLTDVLVMQSRHLRPLPDILTSSQKATCVDSAKRLPLARRKTDLSFLFPVSGQ